MSVYINDSYAQFVDAFESIWDKQFLRPNEIVIVFDGKVSSDINNYLLQRTNNNTPIIIVNSKENIGLGRALNLGLKYCTNEYVARMDSDDISREDRFFIQYNYCLKNPNIDITGGFIQEFNNHGKILGIRKVPLINKCISFESNFRSPMNHVTVMFKKSSLYKISNYVTEFISFEDYATWLKAKDVLVFSNLSNILVDVRIDSLFIERRRGLNYFKREFNFFYYFFKLNKISFIWFLFNIFIRFIFRLSPPFFLEYKYKFSRSAV